MKKNDTVGCDIHDYIFTMANFLANFVLQKIELYDMRLSNC